MKHLTPYQKERLAQVRAVLADTEDGFGIRLRVARYLLGFTQEMFCTEFGIGRSLLSRWEVGHKAPTPEQVDDICAVFGLNDKWLMHGTNLVPEIERLAAVNPKARSRWGRA